MGCHVGVCQWRFRFSEFPSLLTHRVSQVRAPYPSSTPPPGLVPAVLQPPRRGSARALGAGVRKGRGVAEFNTVHRAFFLAQLLHQSPSSFIQPRPESRTTDPTRGSMGHHGRGSSLEIPFFRISVSANTHRDSQVLPAPPSRFPSTRQLASVTWEIHGERIVTWCLQGVRCVRI